MVTRRSLEDYGLDERDLRILAGYSNGEKQQAIAHSLGTTKSYVTKLAQMLHMKLGAVNQAHAVAIAYDLRILEPRGGDD